MYFGLNLSEKLDIPIKSVTPKVLRIYQKHLLKLIPKSVSEFLKI